MSILTEEQFLPGLNKASLNSTLDQLVIKVSEISAISMQESWNSLWNWALTINVLMKFHNHIYVEYYNYVPIVSYLILGVYLSFKIRNYFFINVRKKIWVMCICGIIELTGEIGIFIMLVLIIYRWFLWKTSMAASLLRLEISVREEMVLYLSCMILSTVVTSFEIPEVYIMWQAEELISTVIGV